MPIYPLTAGVSQNLLYKAVGQGLTECRHLLTDCLPDAVRQEHQLCHSGYAYENIHFPPDAEALNLARRRMVFSQVQPAANVRHSRAGIRIFFIGSVFFQVRRT